jgi:cytochrome c oxidase cbb3-type subunit 2
MIENAVADLEAQTNPDADTEAVMQRYPKAVVADFDGNRGMVTEMDAIVAYLQMLGTLVDFREYRTEDLQQ